LDRGDVHHYEEADLGWSVPYHTRELTATVYLYPYNPRQPEDRIASLAGEFAANLAELAAFAMSRGYEVISLDTSPGRVDPNRLDPSARHGSFLLRGSEKTGTSSNFCEIILAISHDEFLKVRCTYTPEKPKRSGVAIYGLLAALRSGA
jgi:hypothetical protein